MERPAPDEYIPYYGKYISLVPEGDVLQVAEEQVGEVRAFVETVPEDMEGYRYAPGKWSVREVLGHLVDVERVLSYRAFAIARGETQALPGFEPDDYAAASEANRSSLQYLAEELEHVRLGNVAFLRRLSEEAWRRVGTASGDRISVRALAYILTGHVRYHLGHLRERYGLGR
jgi:hypothetical protein